MTPYRDYSTVSTPRAKDARPDPGSSRGCYACLVSQQIKIQLPDGSVREVPHGTTPLDIANSISPRLAAAVVVARIRPLNVSRC